MEHTVEVYFPDKRETRRIDVTRWHVYGRVRVPEFRVTGYDVRADMTGLWIAIRKSEHPFPANRSDPCPMCQGYGRISVSGNIGGAPYLLDCSCCGNMDSNPRDPGQVVTYNTGADDVPEHFDSK